MDGVFMRKYGFRIGACLLIAAFFWTAGLLKDRETLHRELVRLHVVGASDSEEDQSVKLRVRDAVLESLQADLQKLSDADAAMAYLEENLPKVETAANAFLESAGVADRVKVSLGPEEFPARFYDTFALPSGIYNTLRVVIGPGEGKNWWCVAFPGLCMGATVEDFEEAASCAGFSDTLTAALETEEGYELRFYFLDLLGRIGNFLHKE